MITAVHRYYLTKLPENIRAKINISEDGCWLWQGEINRNGYGRCWFEGVRHMVHRFIYKHVKASLDNDKLLDHVYSARYCERNCCNPTHVSPVTVRQNTFRGKAKLFVKRKKTNFKSS